MANFNHLKSGKRQTVEYTFHDVVGEPAVTVRHAGESNKPYFDLQLKMAEQIQRRKRRIDSTLVAENRERDRQLFPKLVVVGWRDVKDASGNQVQFNPEECEAFLRALDDDQFDALREFAKDAANFRDFVSEGNNAGNSPSA